MTEEFSTSGGRVTAADFLQYIAKQDKKIAALVEAATTALFEMCDGCSHADPDDACEDPTCCAHPVRVDLKAALKLAAVKEGA